MKASLHSYPIFTYYIKCFYTGRTCNRNSFHCKHAINENTLTFTEILRSRLNTILKFSKHPYKYTRRQTYNYLHMAPFLKIAATLGVFTLGALMI